MPGLARFAWLFFFQPVTLHQKLVASGVDPGRSVWGLLRAPGLSRRWALRFLQLFFACWLGLCWSQLVHLGEQVNPGMVLFLVAFCFFAPLAIASMDMVSGLGFGASIALAWIVSAPVPSKLGAGVFLGVLFSALTVLNGSLESGHAPRLTRGLLLTWAFLSMMAALIEGTDYGAGFGIAALVVYVRVPDYLVSGLFTVVLAILAKFRAGGGVVNLSRYLPYRHHDLLFFPLPGLRSFLVELYRASPRDGEARIAEALASVGQKRPARKAEAQLRAEGRRLESPEVGPQ